MGKLNVDFSKAIGKFEFLMKKKFSVKKVFYRRLFRGKGKEFDSYRAYTPNDDSSMIDWKATMKSGNSPLVKQYIEEKDLEVFFIVDVGNNMLFGSGKYLKGEIAAEVSASIAHWMVMSRNKIGFVLQGDNATRIRKVYGGMEQFYFFAKDLRNTKLYGGNSDLKKVLKILTPHLKKVSAVFIISDFINIDEECAKIFKEFALKYETIGIMVRDRVDVQLPNLNREVIVEDIYTGEQRLINPGLIRHQYERNAIEQKNKIEKIFKVAGADLLTLYTDKDFITPLVNFLTSRVKGRRHIKK